MPRGGKREGAGRPETLTYLQRIAVGSDAHNLMTSRSRREVEQRIDAKLLVERAAAAQAKAGKLTFKMIDARRREFEKQTEAVFGRRKRVYSQRIKRIYGGREEIIRQVALANGVTPRMVVTCLNEYRAFMREWRKTPYTPNPG